MSEKPSEPLLGHYIITLCKDGNASIMERGQSRQRRQQAALPVFSVNDVGDALELIRRLCFLHRVDHGPKIGVLIEPMFGGWPLYGGDLHDLHLAEAAFTAEYAKLQEERAAATPQTPARARKKATSCRDCGLAACERRK